MSAPSGAGAADKFSRNPKGGRQIARAGTLARSPDGRSSFSLKHIRSGGSSPSGKSFKHTRSGDDSSPAAHFKLSETDKEYIADLFVRFDDDDDGKMLTDDWMSELDALVCHKVSDRTRQYQSFSMTGQISDESSEDDSMPSSALAATTPALRTLQEERMFQQQSRRRELPPVQIRSAIGTSRSTGAAAKKRKDILARKNGAVVLSPRSKGHSLPSIAALQSKKLEQDAQDVCEGAMSQRLAASMEDKLSDYMLSLEVLGDASVGTVLHSGWLWQQRSTQQTTMDAKRSTFHTSSPPLSAPAPSSLPSPAAAAPPATPLAQQPWQERLCVLVHSTKGRAPASAAPQVLGASTHKEALHLSCMPESILLSKPKTLLDLARVCAVHHVPVHNPSDTFPGADAAFGILLRTQDADAAAPNDASAGLLLVAPSHSKGEEWIHVLEDAMARANAGKDNVAFDTPLDMASSESAAEEEEAEERLREYAQGRVIVSAYLEEYKKTAMRQPALRCLIRQPLAPVLAAGHCGLDCAGMRALAAVLPSLQNLERINLPDNRLADDGCTLLCQALLQTTATVHALDLDNNHIRLRGARQLHTLLRRGTLTELALSGNRLGDEAVSIVASAIQTPQCALISLDISANGAGELSSKSLSTSLLHPACHLQHLNIAWNNFRGPPAARLALALGASSLTWLDAAWNGFGGMETDNDHAEGEEEEAVGAFVDSRTMRVEKNPGRGASVSMLHISSWLVQSKTLKFLNLSYNRISTEGSVVLAGGLGKCACLEMLKLDGNPIYRAGAKAVWTASAESSDLFQTRRLLSMSACGISSDMAKPFDITEPAGKYALDMGLTYAQTILHSLMKIAARGDGLLVDVRVGGKMLKLNAMATSQSEEEWLLPTTGTLCAKFQWLKAAHVHHEPPQATPMSNIARDTVLDVLVGELRPEDQNVFLKAAFAGRVLDFNQVEQLIKDTPARASRINLICSAFHKLSTQDHQDQVLEELEGEELELVLEKLGPTISFAKYNPTGMYRLDLSDAVQREVALLLCQVKNVELQQRAKEAKGTNKTPTDPPIELIWRNAKMKGVSHAFLADEALPAAGILEVDLVSPALPSVGATAMDEEKFKQLLHDMSLDATTNPSSPGLYPKSGHPKPAKLSTPVTPATPGSASSNRVRGTRWSERRKTLLWIPSITSGRKLSDLWGATGASVSTDVSNVSEPETRRGGGGAGGGGGGRGGSSGGGGGLKGSGSDEGSSLQSLPRITRKSSSEGGQPAQRSQAELEGDMEREAEDMQREAEVRTQKEQQRREQTALAVLRRWSNSHFFTTHQVRRLLSKFKFAPTSAEAFVIIFRRTIDWHGLATILFDLPSPVVEILRRRLGAANLFDHGSAVSYYELDLSVAEERWVLLKLLQCGVDEPGVNIVDSAQNGIAFAIPSPWLTGSCPTSGLMTMFYCREQATIDRLREKSEEMYPGSYPNGWEQPAGFGWVSAFKLRQIKRKFQVIYGDDPRKIFKIIDQNMDGSLTRNELAASLRCINVWLHPNETTALIEALDQDNSDSIDEAEFILFWNRTT